MGIRRGVTAGVTVRRVGPPGAPGSTVPDSVPTEEPLEILVNGALVGTTMRTPGNDFELVAGWCLSEGLLDGDRLLRLRYCPGKGPEGNSFNVVEAETASGRTPEAGRLGGATASCGICGSTSVHDLTHRLAPLSPPAPVGWSVLDRAVAGLRGRQPVFARTGSVHGAGAFRLDDGALDVVREDVGRHNALDKVVGRLLLDERLPASGHGLLLSGRVSVELVQKAWSAGVPVVAAVGGPSSLAVDAAAAANITLVGFLGPERANVYTGGVA